MSAGKKDRKEPLELIGVKIGAEFKRSLDKESEALEIAPGTYARQLLMIGWRSRHEAPVAKNPREQQLIERFNELPVSRQEDILAMVEALYAKDLEDLKRIDHSEITEKIFDNKEAIKKVDDDYIP